MTRIEKTTLFGLSLRSDLPIIEDFECRKVEFQGCYAIAEDPSHRPLIRNIVLERCKNRGCSLDGAIVENVIIKHLDTANTLITWGTVFRHVTFQGRIGTMLLNHLFSTQEHPRVPEAAWRRCNEEFYASVDWALDISQAEFKDIDIRGIPARVIRRNPETQMVLTRETALEGKWRNLDLSNTFWKTAIEMFLNWGYPDTVLVAGKRSATFERQMAGLNLLLNEGIVSQ